jgi:uncharacterized protein YegP (UPF0339 family)
MRATLFQSGTIPLADNDERAGYGDALIIERLEPGCCRFTTYRAERVSVTSALWSGGDWHWRLTGPSGAILADCGGYPDETECLAVIEALRSNARTAHLPLHH